MHCESLIYHIISCWDLSHSLFLAQVRRRLQEMYDEEEAQRRLKVRPVTLISLHIHLRHQLKLILLPIQYPNPIDLQISTLTYFHLIDDVTVCLTEGGC